MVRADTKALREALRALLPYRAAIQADAAALGRVLAILNDTDTSLNHVGRDWLALLGGSENPEVAAAAAVRIDGFRLKSLDRAADAQAIIRLYVEALGRNRDEAVLVLLESLEGARLRARCDGPREHRWQRRVCARQQACAAWARGRSCPSGTVPR
jgi:hypothetical protein